jgi:hypothetical protein
MWCSQKWHELHNPTRGGMNLSSQAATYPVHTFIDTLMTYVPSTYIHKYIGLRRPKLGFDSIHSKIFMVVRSSRQIQKYSRIHYF